MLKEGGGYPSEHVDILQVESDVEQRHEIIDEFEEDQFRDAVALKLRLGPVIL